MTNLDKIIKRIVYISACFLSNRFRGARASFHHFILFLTNFIPIGSSSSHSQQWRYCWEHCVVPSITQTPHPQTQPEPAASIFSYLWSCCKTPMPFKVLLFKGNYLHSMLLRFFFKLFPYLALWGFSCIIWDLSKNVFIFNWRIIALHYCGGFCYISIWIRHRYTHLPSL